MKAYCRTKIRTSTSPDPPPNHEYLIQDLELSTLLGAMAAGDKFLFDISKVLLTSLADPEAIRYRQRVLADCVAEPDIIRQMYAIAVAALQDRRGLWGTLRRTLPPSCPGRSRSSRP